MDLTQVILDFIHQNGLATGIIVFGGWFLVSKVWPWYTHDYLPSATTRQDNRDKIMAELRDAIIELRSLTTQMITSLQQHDLTTQQMLGDYRRYRSVYRETFQAPSQSAIYRRQRDRRPGA